MYIRDINKELNKIRRQWNKQDIELIKEFIDSGKSISFIAAHFDTSPQNIRMVMSRNNLAVRKSSAGKPTSSSSYQQTLQTPPPETISAGTCLLLN